MAGSNFESVRECYSRGEQSTQIMSKMSKKDRIKPSTSQGSRATQSVLSIKKKKVLSPV